MRKLAIVAAVIMLAGTASAVEAVISPGSPDDIVLGPDNSYEVTKTFDGRSSTGSGSLTYNWDWVENSEQASGIEVSFTFNQDDPQTNTIKLTVSNGTDTDSMEVTQVLRDKPEFTSTPGDAELDIDDGSVSKSWDATSDYSISDTFDSSLSYSWSLTFPDNSTEVDSGSDSTFSYTFGTETDGDDEYDLELTATDSAGYSNTDRVGIDVDNSSSSSSSSSSNNNQQSQQTTQQTTQQQSQEEDTFDHVKEVLVEGGQTTDVSFPTPLHSIEVEASALIVGDLKMNDEGDSNPESEDPGGLAYRFFEIEKESFNDSDVDTTTFSFRVEKSWVNENNIIRDSVALQRYDDGWEKLVTSETDENDTHIFYEASSPGFSSFAITGKEASADIQVLNLSLGSSEVATGENVTINVEVENTGDVEGTETVEVDAGGQTLSREVTLSPGENTTVEFQALFSDPGTKTVSAGGQTVQLEVEGTGGGGGSLLFLAVFMLLIVAVLGGVLMYTEADTLEPYLKGIEPYIRGLESHIHSLKDKLGLESGTGYSFEGFGDDDSGEFEYSFEPEN